MIRVNIWVVMKQLPMNMRWLWDFSPCLYLVVFTMDVIVVVL